MWYQYFPACRDLCPPSPDEFFYDWPIQESHRCCVSGCYWPVLVKRCPDCFEKPCQPTAENPSSGTRTQDSSQRLLRAGPPSRRLRIPRMILQMHYSWMIARWNFLAHVFFTVKCISNNIAHRLRGKRDSSVSIMFIKLREKISDLEKRAEIWNLCFREIVLECLDRINRLTRSCPRN